MPWINAPSKMGRHRATSTLAQSRREKCVNSFNLVGPPTFLGMEVKFFPVAMVMMELCGGLPRSEMLEKGKLVS